MSVIEVSHVWKRYRRPPTEVPRRLRYLREMGSGRSRPWALQDISFDVPAGQSVALLGTNGSGKSSLLRILAGTSRQTRGSVLLREPAYGLLTLGEGMNPLLTGRENAVTGAMMAGLSARAAEAAVPGIADFAELTDVMDRPLRTYSDGMRLRLAFATSMAVDPQVLLIDEVLAVGDLRFRERCVRRLRELRGRGVTTVFVSHDLAQVRDLCDRALWLSDGKVVLDGAAEEVVEQYELEQYAALRNEELDDVGDGRRRTGTQAVEITGVRLRTLAGMSTALRSGSAAWVEVDYSNPRRVRELQVTVTVHDGEGRVCLDISTDNDMETLSGLGASGTVTLELERLDLSGGTYGLDVGVYPPDWSVTYDFWSRFVEFQVHGDPSKGPLAPPRRWQHAPDA